MAQEVRPKTIVVYADDAGLKSLKDRKTQERIIQRIQRLESGLYGDCEPVGEGVLELRLFFGPGYRVYFGEDEGQIVILLCGGDKSTQSRDIKTAKELWKEYKDNG